MSTVDLKRYSIQELMGNVQLDMSDGLVSQIFRLLRWHIIKLDLPPGCAISEKEIADALKASKTPVREAIIRLAENGLVQVMPKSGTYVSRIQINNYIEACFVRLRLESGAVERAAQYHGPEDIITLQACITEQKDAWDKQDFDTFYRLDERFHRLFFSIARIPGVWAILERVKIDIDRMRHLKGLHGIRRGDAVIDQHQAIVTAIRAHDRDGAVQALTEHIGSLDAEIDSLSAQPKVLQMIEDLNDADTRRRGKNAA